MALKKIKFSCRVLAILGLLCAQISFATQDVEDPDQILAFMRMLMVVPEVSEAIVELSEQGCVWDDQVIWGGSPSDDELASGIFWKTLSMRFRNKSKQEMWIQFAFASKNMKLIEVNKLTNQDEVIDCKS